MFKRNQHLSIGEAIHQSEVSHYKKDQIQEILCQENWICRQMHVLDQSCGKQMVMHLLSYDDI